jgi:hypothetical protein
MMAIPMKRKVLSFSLIWTSCSKIGGAEERIKNF